MRKSTLITATCLLWATALTCPAQQLTEPESTPESPTTIDQPTSPQPQPRKTVPATPAPKPITAPSPESRELARKEADLAKLRMEQLDRAYKNGIIQKYTYTAGKTEKAAYVGVSGSPIPPALAQQLKLPKGVGLLVDFVEPKSPADEAGVKQYDVLHKLDDQLLINAHQFAVLVRTHKAGEDVTLTVIHQGEAAKVKVKLAERDVMALDESNPWGLPPTPAGLTPSEFNVTYFKPQLAGGPVDVHTVQKVPVLSDVPLVGRLFTNTTVTPDGNNANGGAEVRWNDDAGGLTLRTNQDGHRVLTVLTKDGKTVSTYQLDQADQYKTVPDGVRERLKKMQLIAPVPLDYRPIPVSPNPATPAPAPQPQPAPQPGAPGAASVPGFGQPGIVQFEFQTTPLPGQPAGTPTAESQPAPTPAAK